MQANFPVKRETEGIEECLLTFWFTCLNKDFLDKMGGESKKKKKKIQGDNWQSKSVPRD